nr:hypothetical protein [Tanacetum cinerariifolium]
LTRAWRMDESGSNRANGTRILSRAYDFTPWLLNLAYTPFLASLGSVMTSFEKDLSVIEFDGGEEGREVAVILEFKGVTRIVRLGEQGYDVKVTRW